MIPKLIHTKGLLVYLLLCLVLLCTSHAFDLNSTTLSIAENQPTGTTVGETNASASNGNFTFEVSGHTSQSGSADTLEAIGISFFVNGAWTANETFFSSASLGSVKIKSFSTLSKPTKLKFSSGSNADAWGYWKITINGSAILENPNGITGSPIGTQPYWVDGDGSAGTVATQIHIFPSQSYTFSLVDGNGSSGNSLFNLESNGTLKTSTILDYESNASHSIRIRAIDELNASVERSFDVNVTDDLNDNPPGSTFVFSNAAATGRLGPTQSQIDANYSSTNLANSVTINTQGIQEWTVPSTGNYRIEATGAKGGGTHGGHGAKMIGTFTLSANSVLKILVGQMGTSLTSGRNDHSGGGGTFVIEAPYDSSAAILVIAGGGGGALVNGTTSQGSVSSSGSNGSGGHQNGSGGTNGNGGNKDNQTTDGGAGFLTNGQSGNPNPAPNSFINGGQGGSNSWQSAASADGGFGGGGGTNRNSTSYWGTGGGGGYSGGGGSYGQASNQPLAGGGGSFNSGSEQNNTSGANQGHGRVIITQLSGNSAPSNQAPANLQPIASLSIPENQPTGSFVGEFNATDTDTGDTLTYTLVDGNGSTGNALFTLESNGTLKTASILDFEANTLHSIRVRVSDDHNASAENTFVVNVTDDTNENTLPQGTTYLFSNAGATGRLGPTQSQIDANYSGTNLVNSVTINTQGIQEWTVPASGDYRIEAWGARGGSASWNSAPYSEGLGAKMAGKFTLNSSETLKILVGQEGSPQHGASGGGGSFVVLSNGNIKLVIAGGGGGSGSGGGASGQGSNRHAVVTSDGMAGTPYSSDQAGAGGTNGGAGGTVTSSWNGYGGSGFSGNGSESFSFLNGGMGGPGYNSNSPGGFGSGGGGGMWGAGGGGGYSGGGNNSRHAVGGGAGSFNSGSDQNNTVGTNQGHGRVIITYLSGSAGSTLNNGLVAWYPLDGNGTDQSATANHGTVHGATPTADRHGVVGKALLFGGSGSNHYLEAPFSQALSSSSFSYSIWANPTSTTTNHGSPITFRGNGRGFMLYKMPQNIWSHWTGDGSWRKFDAQAITLNWTALAFTHNGTTGKCYQNGVLVASLNKGYLPNQSAALRIGTGSGTNGPTYFFKGVIDEVRIWNRVLSAEEISSLYAMEKPTNSVPTDLNSTSALAFHENQPAGTLVGHFNATDPDTNHTLSFSLLNGGNLFSLDVNGTLRTLHVFDFETNASTYSISVRVTDEHNASLDGNFTVALLNQVEDLDGDGMEDYYDNDDDGDGFSDSTETAYGSDPRDPNSVANAAPNALDLNGSNILENQTGGTFVGKLLATDPDTNHTLSFSLLNGGNLFSLDVNGTLRTLHVFDFETNASTFAISVRLTDEHNASLDGNFTISLLNQVEDLDGDGTEDHYDNDDDGDGFSDSTETAYGSDPHDSNSVANAAPNALDLNGSSIQENQAAGTLVGKLLATDPDTNATLSFSLLSGGNLFSLDVNGSLRTLHVFDFETNASTYAISIRVTDEHNASLDGNFTISLLNQVEDLDGDGTEDHYDNDDDGDGFSDSTETAYGSDPRDSNSVANAAPNALDLNGSSILENQAAGTLVGKLLATDPDTNATLSISLLSGGNLFSLDINGTLRTLHVFDFETNASTYAISVRVTDEHNASLDGNFTIVLLNQVEDLDGDGTEDHYDNDDDGDGFSDSTETAYGSNPRDSNSLANAAPNTLDLNGSSILENQPFGTLVGKLLATDSDANASLSFSLIQGTGSEDNHLFYLEGATVRTLAVFDYEAGAALPQTGSSSPESNDTRLVPLESSNHSESNASVRQPEKGSSVSFPGPILDQNQSITETPSSHAHDGNLSFSSPLRNSNPTGPELPDSNSTRRAGESFGFENQATLFRVRIRVIDEHNASLEKAFVIELLNQIEDFDGDGVEDAFDPDDVVYLMPELGTIETILLENGRVSLSVGFKANSDFTLPSFAFQLSGNANFKGDLRTIPGSVEQDLIHGSIPDLKPGTTYHVRLLATHRAKQSHSSSTSFQIPSVVKHWWESESPAESGWRTSPWLGSFRPYSNGWIYHIGLGWAYAQSDGQDGLWLWMEAEGWVWSAPQCWPHLWKDRSTNWLYFVKEHEGKPALYDYVTESFRWK
jgi:hypothetical protein